jgi:hypothetical protein
MNHGKTTSVKRNSGQKLIQTERDRHPLKRTVSENHRTTAALSNWTAELHVPLGGQVSTKTVQRELHKFTIHSRAAIAKPLITESNAHMRKQWCPITTIKPGHQTTGNMHLIHHCDECTA